jgi:hypothetical protein
MIRKATTTVAALIVGLLLAGCSFSFSIGNNAIDPTELADKAAAALQESVGTDYLPIIDCGTEDIEYAEGKTVSCDLTDPTTNEAYVVEITMSNRQGKTFDIHAKVLD